MQLQHSTTGVWAKPMNRGPWAEPPAHGDWRFSASSGETPGKRGACERRGAEARCHGEWDAGFYPSSSACEKWLTALDCLQQLLHVKKGTKRTGTGASWERQVFWVGFVPDKGKERASAVETKHGVPVFLLSLSDKLRCLGSQSTPNRVIISHKPWVRWANAEMQLSQKCQWGRGMWICGNSS